MVFKDPPEHTRLRRLAGKVFNVRSMQRVRATATGIAEHLLDRVDGRDSIDLIADFAGPLPCLVIMAMLGVPRESLADVKRMSDESALFIGSSRTSPEKCDTAQAATRERAAFFRELIEERRRRPSEDAVSELVQARDGDDRFTDDGLVAPCILMLFAGHETTTSVTKALLGHSCGSSPRPVDTSPMMTNISARPTRLAASRADPRLIGSALRRPSMVSASALSSLSDSDPRDCGRMR
jgi:cytochrome P450